MATITMFQAGISVDNGLKAQVLSLELADHYAISRATSTACDLPVATALASTCRN